MKAERPLLPKDRRKVKSFFDWVNWAGSYPARSCCVDSWSQSGTICTEPLGSLNHRSNFTMPTTRLSAAWQDQGVCEFANKLWESNESNIQIQVQAPDVHVFYFRIFLYSNSIQYSILLYYYSIMKLYSFILFSLI